MDYPSSSYSARRYQLCLSLSMFHCHGNGRKTVLYGTCSLCSYCLTHRPQSIRAFLTMKLKGMAIEHKTDAIEMESQTKAIMRELQHSQTSSSMDNLSLITTAGEVSKIQQK